MYSTFPDRTYPKPIMLSQPLMTYWSTFTILLQTEGNITIKIDQLFGRRIDSYNLWKSNTTSNINYRATITMHCEVRKYLQALLRI